MRLRGAGLKVGRLSTRLRILRTFKKTQSHETLRSGKNAKSGDSISLNYYMR
ncbi:hypothetical protein MCETHM1_02803 [Flavobacteriaceae bacterium]|jgi:hypothetical protein